MSLDEFFDEEDPDLELEDKEELISEEELEISVAETKQFSHKLSEDINNVFLIDAKYDGKLNKAILVFYDLKTESLYYWVDNTNHHPYLITPITKEGIEEIPGVAQSQNYLGTEPVEKEVLLEWGKSTFSKVLGSTPLDIGGDAEKSFRNFIKPSYEADIRYHFNYIADFLITPGTFYDVKDSKLLHSEKVLPEDIVNQLNHSFEGESDQEIEMLNDYMPNLFQEIPDIFRAAYDIEVGSEFGRLPNPKNPTYPIISIALADNKGRQVFWILNRDETKDNINSKTVEIYRFDSERALLESFFEIIELYPLLISFNGDNFDNPYLYNRALALEMTNKEIPINIRRNETGFKSSLHLDLHIFFRQAAIRIYAFSGAYESASLDEVSRGLLNEHKVEHEEVWINEMNGQTLMKYNLKDVDLTLRLTTYNNNLVLNLIFTLMRITKSPFSDFTRLTVSTWIKFWLIWEHRKRQYLVPLKEEIAAKAGEGHSQSIIEGKRYQGAIVIDPQPGVWWNVQVFDFASLYPSLIKTRNLSYETINCIHEECKSNRVPDVNHWVCTKRIGIMSLMIGFVRDIRVKYFKPRKKERNLFRVTEQALKVLINAGYGVIGSPAFDFYCLPVAESTTAYARDAITRTQNFVTTHLKLRVLYGDTDSVFIHEPSDNDVKKLKKWSIDNLGVELGLDYDFRYAIFSERKKNYLGVTKSGQVVVKGLVGKKRNTPNIIRDYFDETLEILSKVHNIAELNEAKSKIKNTIRELIKKVEDNDLKIPDVVIRTTFTNRVKDYQTWTQPIQALAQLLENNYPGAESIDIGDSIEYVPVRDPVKVRITSSRLSFPTDKESIKTANVKPVQLVDLKTDRLGRNLLKLAQSAFEQILNPMGISWEKDIMGQQSIDDFFG